jgi:phosphohistidine swiveling domain-containing protein
MKNNNFFVNNFSIHRSGYSLAAPCLYGIINAQKVLFGKDKKPVLNKFFFVFEGVNLTQAPHDKAQLRKAVEAIIEKIIKQPQKVAKIHQQTYQLNDEYFAYAQGCVRLNLLKISNKELGKAYLKLSEWQEKAHQYALTTTWYLDSDGEDFSKLLIEKTKEFCIQSGLNINFANVFSVLTTSHKGSLAAKEELESLKIVKLIMNDKSTKEIFLNLENYQKIPTGVNSRIGSAIKRHFEKWRWFAFNYMGPAYDIDYFLQVWAGLIRQDVDVDYEIKKLSRRPAEIKKQRQKIFNDLKVGGKWREIYDIAADIVNLKGYRKECCFHGSYVMSFLLQETAKRLNLSLSQVYLLTFDEIEDALIKGKKIKIDKINERNGFTVMSHNNGKAVVLTGAKAKKFYASKNIFKEKINKNVKELQGTCACSGQAKGVVRIVNLVEEIHKMEKGNIMVAHTTFPNLVPAMKKAAAIVTEDGGITCHAAIVAREMNTPCITGIKIATKVLKDGQIVEVDADNGIVKIIN